MNLAKSIQKIHDKLIKAAAAGAAATSAPASSSPSSPSSSSSSRLGGRYIEQGWKPIKRRPKIRFSSADARATTSRRREFSTALGGRWEKEQTATLTSSLTFPRSPVHLFPTPRPASNPPRKKGKKSKSTLQEGRLHSSGGEQGHRINDGTTKVLLDLDPNLGRLENRIKSLGVKKGSLNPQVGDWIDYGRSSRTSGIIVEHHKGTYLVLNSASIYEKITPEMLIAFLPLLSSPFASSTKALRILDNISELNSMDIEAVASSQQSASRLKELEHPLIQYTREVETALERKRRDLMAMDFDQLYDRIHLFSSSKSTRNKPIQAGGKNDREGKEVDVNYCLHSLGVRGIPTPIEKLAMLDLLIRDGEHFIYLNSSKYGDGLPHSTKGNGVDNDGEENGRKGGAKFRVREKQFVEDFSFLRSLLRRREEKDSILHEFVGKARKIISSRSDAHVNATGSVTPTINTSPTTTISWTLSEQRILRFLYKASSTEMRRFQETPWHADLALVLKLLYPSSPEISSSSPLSFPTSFDGNQARKFLKDVSIVNEWDNWVVHEHEAMLLREWPEDDMKLESLYSESAPLTSPASASTIGMADQDECDAIRQDFGSERVYTIDDPNASELDDGISVSPGPVPNQKYVTVHIADPTSSVSDPFSPIAQVVRKRFRTEYFPERNWKMFPEWFLARKGMSLGDGGKDGKGSKTVFVKFLVENGGEIIGEAEVGVGWVKDFRKVTYGAVDRLLGYEEMRETKTYYMSEEQERRGIECGMTKMRETDDEKLFGDEKAKEDLNFLWELSKASLKKRVDDGSWFFNYPQALVQVEPAISYRPVDFATSTALSSDPTRTGPVISLTTGREHQDTPAQTLVSELMILANRFMSRYFTERSLPTLYRTQTLFADASPASSVLSTIYGLRHPLTGGLDFREMLKLGEEAVLSPAKFSTTPGPHAIMGICDPWGYTKVTSPLRRYDDLVAHWQLKESLSKNRTKFPMDTMEKIFRDVERAQKERGRIERFANFYWTAYFLDKVHRQQVLQPDLAPSPIIENLAAFGMREPNYNFAMGRWIQPVILKEFGVRMNLNLDSEGDGIGLGEEKRVQFENFEVGHRSAIFGRLRK